MADHDGSYIRGVLDGDHEPSDITAHDREHQAQQEIENEILIDRITPFATPVVTTAAPGTGGGYKFDAAHIAALIPKWEQIRDDIEGDGHKLEAVWSSVEEPSPDQPAVENAQQIRKSIKAAIDENQGMWDYARAWIDNLSKANGTYAQHDEDTAKGMYSDGGATDGSGLYR